MSFIKTIANMLFGKTEPSMNLDETRRTIQSALADLKESRNPASAASGRFLAIGKLEYVLENMPTNMNAEMARLQKFERTARGILGCPYGIHNATWKDKDGNFVELRVLDNKQVLELLRS